MLFFASRNAVPLSRYYFLKSFVLQCFALIWFAIGLFYAHTAGLRDPQVETSRPMKGCLNSLLTKEFFSLRSETLAGEQLQSGLDFFASFLGDAKKKGKKMR